MSLKIASWNINGIRACYKKGFLNWVNEEKKDIFCLQEIKASPSQFPEEIINHPDYHVYIAESERKGYSGVALFSHKKLPEPKITIGLGKKKFDAEGRTVIAEYKDFILFGCYFPNGGSENKRVSFKLEYSRLVAEKALELKKKKRKPIIITGDYNTAHTEIDLKNPKANVKNTGFLPKERKWIDQFVDQGFVDIFRKFHPGEKDHYTWWTYRMNCRAKNVGWRIDYFFITKALEKKVKKSYHRPEVMGSDHCPIYLELD